MTRVENGDTLLHLACRHNHAHIVQYLLSTGKVNPLAKNKNGETPMFNLITRTIMSTSPGSLPWLDEYPH